MKRILVSLALIVFALGLLTPAFASVPRAEKIGINTRGGKGSWVFEFRLATDKIAPYISAISQTKVGYVRVFIPWDYIQPEAKKNSPPAEWQWDKIDLMINNIKANDMEPLVVLSSQPAWATQATTNVERDNYLPYKTPWNNFITAMVNRYGYVQGGRQQVQSWEILNEPDAPERKYSSQDYGEFLKSTYTRIQSLDPRAKVLNGGLTQWSVRVDKGDWLNKFLSYNHAEFANYFDYFSIHRYGDANTAGSIVNATKEIFQEKGITKPIWVTETNMGRNFYKPSTVCNPAGEETKYLVFKTFFDNILRAGADKVFLLSADCTPWAGPGIFVRDSANASSPSLIIIQNALTALTKDVASFIPLASPTPTPTPNPADLNQDGKVDIYDYKILVADFGKTGTPGWIKADIDKDGKVDIFDYNVLVGNFGK